MNMSSEQLHNVSESWTHIAASKIIRRIPRTMASRRPFAALLALAVLSPRASAAAPPPHGHACTPPDDAFPWCDASQPVAARVAALVGAMTLAEKISLTYDGQPAIPRLGLSTLFNYNLEGLHGLGSHCMPAEGGATGCPTIFPAPPALGAAFNTSLMTLVGVAISDEVRAMNNAYGSRNYANRPVDLNLWLPSINLNINYLWGRNIEVYGEDPLLAGRLAAALVRGVQWNGADGPGSAGLKVYATIKHYTGYQVETNRFAFDASVSERDLVMTYLLPFQIAAAEGGNVGAMCAYPALNSVPMCGAPVFERGVLREEFGMGLAGQSYIQADCGAVGNMNSQHHYVGSDVEAAALALNSGTDIDCAHTMPDNLAAAIAANLTSEAALDASVSRVLGLSFLAGRFDPLANQPYTRIPLSALGAPAHSALSFDAALQGMVLLRNDGVLPLAAGGAIAVIGPFGANQADLAGNYYECICSNNTADAACVPSIFTSVASANAGGATVLEPGCDMVDATKQNISGAVAVASAADVVILAIGINSQVCNEGTDRTTLALPGAQAPLAAAVLALGKPTVVVIVAGAVLDVAAIAARAAPTAIVLAGPPGNQGGAPVALQLFGGANRWGRTTLSHYLAANLSNALPPEGYDMSAPPGRTYKYTRLPVQWPFGAGLSYTNFTVAMVGAQRRHATSAAALAASDVGLVQVNVTNVGRVAGDDVVLVFVQPSSVPAFPGGNDTLAKTLLADFARVSLAPGQSVVLSFNVSAAFAQADASGDMLLASGDYAVRVTDDTGRGGAGDAVFAVRLDIPGGAELVRESPLRRARAKYGGA